MLEVFTIGGGEYIVNVLNAVAAWTGGGGFRSMIQVVMVMGLAYSLLIVAFGLNWRVWFNWFVSATLMYMCLIVPTTSIKVTDRINPGLAPAIVANVPVGLAAMAAFSSQIGDWMTRRAETVFVMPGQLQMSTNGFIYGARLFDKTQSFEFHDPRIRSNVEEYFKQCLFYDFMLGFKSVESIAQSTNILVDMGPGSAARAMRYGDATGRFSIVTCNSAYTQLVNVDIPRTTDNELTRLAPRMFPNLSAAAAKAKLLADLPAVGQAFFNGSQSAPQVFQQKSLVSAFLEARGNLSAADGDTFAMLRADTQARNTYTSISQQAMTWVPLLNIVLTVVFYAMFPVIFPLFLMPQTGPTALKGYITGFFYLAAWGPLYVVLHMFVMGRTISAMQAASPGGITMAGMSGIDAVNADTATIAGFLMMSVPFLAAGLARGAMAVASNATSMLAPAQSAAEAAANERTSGNYAYGNLSYQNLTGNTVQRDQWREAPSFEGGAAVSAFRTNEGATIRNYSDGAGGATVYDTSAARSSMGFSIQEGKAIHAMAKASEDRTRNESLSLSYQASQLESSGTRTFHGHSTSDTTSSGADSRSMAENSVSQTHGRTNQNANSMSSTNSSNWGEQTSRGDRASVGTDASMGVSGTLSASANAGGGAGGGGSGAGSVSGNLGIGASNNNRVDWKGSESEFGERSRSSGKSRSDSTGSRSEFSESATNGSSESTSNSAARYNSNSRSSSNNAGSETSDDHREQLLRQADRKMAESRSWHRIAERLESNDFRMSEDLMPVLQSRYEELRQSGEMGVNLPAFFKVNLTDTERGVRSIALSRIMTNLSAEQLDSFANDHRLPEGDLPVIDPSSISMPSIPRGISRASAASGGPDDSPGRFPVPEIQAGRVDGRALARDAGVSIKVGANVRELDGEMAPVMGAVANASARLGLPSPTVTSGNDSTQHVDGSQHYENRAIDFRGRDITISQGHALAREVQADLGAGYRANFEVFADEPTRNHLHVQLIGKR